MPSQYGEKEERKKSMIRWGKINFSNCILFCLYDCMAHNDKETGIFCSSEWVLIWPNRCGLLVAFLILHGNFILSSFFLCVCLHSEAVKKWHQIRRDTEKKALKQQILTCLLCAFTNNLSKWMKNLYSSMPEKQKNKQLCCLLLF